MNNHNYAYIIGRLRALETQMLSQNSLERMLDAKTPEEAYKVLHDLPLVAPSIAEHAVRDYEKVLTGSLRELKHLLTDMSPYPEVLNFLWNKYDFHNLKVILKAELSGHGYAEVEHALVDMGTHSLAEWEAYLLERKPLALVDRMSCDLDPVRQRYEKNQDPQEVDMMLDKCYLKSLFQIASTLQSPLISSYLKKLSDLTNLKTFLRCSQLKKEASYLEGLLVSGGSIAPQLFLEHYEKGADALTPILEKKIDADEMTDVLSEFNREKQMIAVDKRMTELLQEFMLKSKQISFGPEPVFAFFWTFENHLQIIRSVLVGKLNRLETQAVNSYLPNL